MFFVLFVLCMGSFCWFAFKGKKQKLLSDLQPGDLITQIGSGRWEVLRGM